MKSKRTLLIGTVAAIAAAITISIQAANDDHGPTAEVRDDVQETPPPGKTRPTKAGTSKPEIANLIDLVERSRFSEAAQLAADNNVGLDRAVMEELSRRQSQSELDPQVHFNFLHFFLKYGKYGNASNPEQLRADYCRLLSHRLASIAARDVDLALRELAAVSVEMELSAEEIEQQQRTIVGAPFRQLFDRLGQSFPSGKSGHSERVEEQRRRAKALLAQLIERATSDRQRLITLGIKIADAEHDAEALNRFAGIWMETNRFSDRSPMDSSSVAPIIASHYAATDRWQRAHDAWKRWPASHGFCMSWDVFPSEIRLVQMSICKLHQQEYRHAVDILVKGMTDPEVDSRCLLPLLLFHIYRRADQLDDLWVILDQWSDNEAFQEFNKHRYGDGGTGMTISRMRLQRARLMELCELAAAKDWPALIRVCRGAKENAKSASHMQAFRYGSLLEGSLAALASVLLSEADHEGAEAIEDFYRDLPATDVAERRGNESWIVRSLLENPSEQAWRFVQSLQNQNPLIRSPRRRITATPIERLAEQAYWSGAFTGDDRAPPNASTRPDISTLRIFFQWNSPPKGSLRRELPLVLNE